MQNQLVWHSRHSYQQQECCTGSSKPLSKVQSLHPCSTTIYCSLRSWLSLQHITDYQGTWEQLENKTVQVMYFLSLVWVLLMLHKLLLYFYIVFTLYVYWLLDVQMWFLTHFLDVAKKIQQYVLSVCALLEMLMNHIINCSLFASWRFSIM